MYCLTHLQHQREEKERFADLPDNSALPASTHLGLDACTSSRHQLTCRQIYNHVIYWHQ